MKAILIFPLMLLLADAAGVLVTWTANPESDIRNYQLKAVSTTANEPERVIETPGLSAEMDGLSTGETYEFSLVAVNTSGMRSSPSPATTYTVPSNQKQIVILHEWSADLKTWHPFLELRLPVPMSLPDGTKPDRVFFRSSHPAQQ